MQYLVNLSGDVLVQDKREKSYIILREKTYLIKAENIEQAQSLAEKRFYKEFIVSDAGCECDIKPPKEYILFAIGSMVALALTIILSYRNWYPSGGYESVSICPGFFTIFYLMHFT